jgi:thioredoxin reductase
MDARIFDVLIIGAGPIGIACALEETKRQVRIYSS